MKFCNDTTFITFITARLMGKHSYYLYVNNRYVLIMYYIKILNTLNTNLIPLYLSTYLDQVPLADVTCKGRLVCLFYQTHRPKINFFLIIVFYDESNMILISYRLNFDRLPKKSKYLMWMFENININGPSLIRRYQM